VGKSTERVPDKCAVCGSDLYCETCQCVSKHRPYPKQLLKQLIARHRPEISEQAFKLLGTVRNKLCHGTPLAEFSAPEQLADIAPIGMVDRRTGVMAMLDFDGVINLTAEIAWEAICRAIPGFEQPQGTLERKDEYLREASDRGNRSRLGRSIGRRPDEPKT
jgi:hypothetical protein